MPTRFVATVKSSGGDYTGLQSAINGLQNDITAADIKTFYISSTTNPGIAPGDSVTGVTSTATGTCVLVNKSATQILIKSISGTFSAGETIKKTSDAGVNVVIVDAGDSPIIQIDCYAIVDGQVGLWSRDEWGAPYFKTSQTNFIHIRAPLSERHKGKYDNTKYCIEVDYTGTTTDEEAAFAVRGNYIKVDGIQVKITIPTTHYDKEGINIVNIPWAEFNNFIVKAVNANSSVSSWAFRYNMTSGGSLKLWNGLFIDWSSTYVYSRCLIQLYGYGAMDFYNLTFKNCRNNGVWGDSGRQYIHWHNCGATSDCVNMYFTQDAAFNCSTSDPVFVDSSNNDFRLSPFDTVWTGQAADRSGVFQECTEEKLRSIPWSIGASQYIPDIFIMKGDNMYDIMQNSSTYELVFQMLDSLDHMTGKTGLSPTVTICKEGSTSFSSPSGAVAEIANGWYKVAGNATDSNTLGILKLKATATGADVAYREYRVIDLPEVNSIEIGGETVTGLQSISLGADNGVVVSTDDPIYTWIRNADKYKKNRQEEVKIGADWFLIVFDDDNITPILQYKIEKYGGGAIADLSGTTTPVIRNKNSI